ncbi:MAG: molybdopterin-guanine dinucleotide biosynthesis protein MobB [Dehalococcoidia bacterium]
MPIVRITAPGRNVGKTLLASRLIEELAGRGYVVAALKHSHHGITPDRAGSDSDRFARAGAAVVLFGGADGWLTRSKPETLEGAIEPLQSRVDIVVVEGFRDDALGASIYLEPGMPMQAHLVSMDGRALLSIAADEVPTLASALIQEFQLSADGPPSLQALIRRAAGAHGHRCAGITLGVRMALAGLSALNLERPVDRDRLDVVVETARCAADAIASTIGLTVGSGRLHIDERGRMAAVFTDRISQRAVRVAAADAARDEAPRWAPASVSRRHQQDIAYRLMPDDRLLRVDLVSALSESASGGAGAVVAGRDRITIGRA